MSNTNLNEDRVIIRDSYGHKHYEILQEDGETFIIEYGLGRFLEEEEKAVLEEIKL